MMDIRRIVRRSGVTGIRGRGLVLALLISLLRLWHLGHAADFACTAGDVACLIQAINTANANGEANTITLEAGTYTLTAVDNTTDGPNGLPSITSSMTIGGDSTATTVIEGNPNFRMFHVAATGALTLEQLTVTGAGSDALKGGGILNAGGTLTIIQSTIAHNFADAGGGISNSGVLTILNSTIVENHSNGGGGGGISHTDGVVDITNSVIVGNAAEVATGGGLFNRTNGTVTITHSTIASNFADAGGGIINGGGTMTIATSTIVNNGASSGTGGIVNGGTLTVINSTVAKNTTTNSDGGGIANFGTLTVLNSTVSGNAALGARIEGSGGGILNSGTVQLQNTILALNTAPNGKGPDCFGTVTSLGNNLLGDPTDCTISVQASDLTGDPRLDAFTDDGTPGHGRFPILPDSPAIDAGNDAACLPTDQLGQPRVGPCDIGAIEFQPIDP
jgi:hypothetical protein